MVYCPDFTPDKNVGTVTKGLLVGSVDRMKELRVTHILIVSCGIPNAFPNVPFFTAEWHER